MIGQIVRKIRYLKYRIRYGKRLSIGTRTVIPKSTIIRINGSGSIIIGNNVELRENVVLNVSDGGVIQISNNVFINDYSCINSRDMVAIQEGVQIGQAVKIYDHDHDYFREDYKYRFKTSPVTIGKNVWIGSDSIILCGTNIGENSVIGAGCLVKRKLPSNVVFMNQRTEKYITFNRY